MTQLTRVLEREAMDSRAEAVGYDTMDHSGVNRVFVDDLLAVDSHADEVLDLGTGTAQIPIELCGRSERFRVVAVDAAGHMLRVAAENVDAAGLTERIQLARVDAKALPYADSRFPVVMSNSLLHHLAEPELALREAWRVLAPGGLLFFRDLVRPADEATLRRLLELYVADDTPHQRQMFEDSLRAALSLDEVRNLVQTLSLNPNGVQLTSDRHWTLTARKG
ncbi:MAG: class I SAM-dependent methyltransferase [Pirellulales bacterium]|nr:class I SAM-dependent methyltransferase [Pirellulales bacterium]